jgi:hypothetical protein
MNACFWLQVKSLDARSGLCARRMREKIKLSQQWADRNRSVTASHEHDRYKFDLT